MNKISSMFFISQPFKKFRILLESKKRGFKWNHNIKFDIVINLCGENIAKKRWNKKFKKIYDSRIKQRNFIEKNFKS